MTGSTFLILIVVLAGIFYLLFRRRGSRHSEAIKPLRSSGESQASTASSDLKPFKPGATGGTAGLPPRPTAHDSGSSHPAYPVAPAKYSGAPTIKTDSGSHYEPLTGSVDRAHRPPSLAMKQEAGSASVPASGDQAPPAAEPWYPEAPASYTDGEAPEDKSRVAEPGRGQ